MSQNIFYLDQPKPEGDWIGWKAWLELAGSHHVGPAVGLFAVAASKAKQGDLPYSLQFQREPDNAFDKKAIAAYGTVGSETWRLGYLPRGEAQDLAKFDASMPLSGRVMSVKFLNDSVYVRVQVLVPSKKWRTAQGWEPKPRK